MGEMDDFDIGDLVDKSEVNGKTSRFKPYLDKILNHLKGSPDKALKLKINAANIDELKKKIHLLRTQARYLGKDSDYGKLKFTIIDDGNNQFRAYAEIGAKAKKLKPAKANKKAQAQTITQSETQQGWTDETQKNFIQSINNGEIPAGAMGMLLAQNKRGVESMQKKLDDAATKEEDKAAINKQMQYSQEVLDAIKKKLGQ